MAGGGPTIEVPTVQPEAAPSPVTPAPPLGAFGGAVGAGLSEVGEKLYGIGYAEYHRAAEAHAQEAETAFQKRALELRDQYRNLRNWDAVQAHQEITQKLEDARRDIGLTLGSKYGRSLYANNTLRNSRFVQESIDSHFEQQNRSYQGTQYKQSQAVRVTSVATFAAEQPYNEKAVEETIDDAYHFGKRRASQLGMEADAAEDYAKNEAHKATDALFRQLLAAKADPALIKTELAKYTERGLVDAGRQKDAAHGLAGAEVNAWVAGTMGGFSRVDSLREKDPEGSIHYADVVRAQEALAPDDPQRQAKVDGLEREWSRHVAAFNRAGAELENTVIAKGSLAGRFAVPSDDLDWQKFRRLYPERAMLLEDKAGARAYRDQRRGAVTARDASRSAYGVAREFLDRLAPEDVNNVTPAHVDQIMRDAYRGPGVNPDPVDRAKAQEFLKKVQAGKLDPLERRFNQIASQVLGEAYKGNRQKVQSAMSTAHLFLEDAYNGSGKKMDESALREALTKQAPHLLPSKFFGIQTDAGYVRPPKGAALGKDGNWYVPNADGSGYEDAPWRPK